MILDINHGFLNTYTCVCVLTNAYTHTHIWENPATEQK